MSYEQHPAFVSPFDDVAIWRYMSLSKFLSMLDRSALYFTSGKTMSELEWFEGKPTAADEKVLSCTWDDASPEYKASLGNPSREVFEMLHEVHRSSLTGYLWEWSA